MLKRMKNQASWRKAGRIVHPRRISALFLAIAIAKIPPLTLGGARIGD
jgi:hypothetical protein